MGTGHASKREVLNNERRIERERRQREVVRDAIRLRAFSPPETIEMMIGLSNICVELGRGRVK